jgi:fibronectin-binding autotransporter adhesin
LSGSTAVTVNGGELILTGTEQVVLGLVMTGGVVTGGRLSALAFGLQSGSVSSVLAGAGVLTKSGAGVVTLTGANVYSGGTLVNGGTLLMGAGGLLPATGAVTVSGTGALDLGGADMTVGSFTLSGGTLLNGALRATSYTLNSGTISADLVGTASANKVSPGLVLLNGEIRSTGDVNVLEGTLKLGASERLSDEARLYINGGTTWGTSPRRLAVCGCALRTL